MTDEEGADMRAYARSRSEIERLQEQVDAIHRVLDRGGVPRRVSDRPSLSALERVQWLLEHRESIGVSA